MKSMNYMLTALFALLVLSLTACAADTPQAIPQAIVFLDTNFGGNHAHFFDSNPDLTSGSNEWNDDISSIVVLYGNWSFYANPVGAGDTAANPHITLGPGTYPDLTKLGGMADNTISQVRLNSAS
jgi:hypothetical protein